MLETCIVAAVVGIAVGVFSGLLGIGGGSVMIPLFRLGFGLSAVASTATSLFTIIPTSLSGAITHVRKGTCIPKLGIALGLGGACTSPIGVWLAQRSPSWMVMAGAALVIGYSATTMLRKAFAAPRQSWREVAGVRVKRADSPSASPAGDAVRKPGVASGSAAADQASEGGRSGGVEERSVDCAAGLSGKKLVLAAVIGALAGVAAGYVGLGGGFIMVPLILSVLHAPMKIASGTSLIGVMILALPATVAQCMLGNVDYVVGITMACGSIPGAYFGAKLTSRVPERALRFGFAAFLGLAAVMLVVNEFGLLG